MMHGPINIRFTSLYIYIWIKNFGMANIKFKETKWAFVYPQFRQYLLQLVWSSDTEAWIENQVHFATLSTTKPVMNSIYTLTVGPVAQSV